MVSDDRIAAILADRSSFRERVRRLSVEAGTAGDRAQVTLCQAALSGNAGAEEECARTLATVDTENDGKQKLESGYAYVAKGDLATIPNDDWETEVITPRGDEYECGRTRIDGTMCRVWWSPELQANVAQVLFGE
jgi:hypothetical protein